MSGKMREFGKVFKLRCEGGWDLKQRMRIDMCVLWVVLRVGSGAGAGAGARGDNDVVLGWRDWIEAALPLQWCLVGYTFFSRELV